MASGFFGVISLASLLGNWDSRIPAGLAIAGWLVASFLAKELFERDSF